MNKFIGLIGVVIVIAGLGWLNRVDLLLMVVKFQSERNFEIGPTRDLPW